MEDKAPRMTLLSKFDIDRLLFGEEDFLIGKSADDLDEDGEDWEKDKNAKADFLS